MEKDIVNFLLKLNESEGLNPSEDFLKALHNNVPIEDIKSALDLKYESQNINLKEKECDLTTIRMYEFLTDDSKPISALVDDIKYIYKFLNKDITTNFEYRDFDTITEYEDISIKHVSTFKIKSYMNYDFKYNIDYFKDTANESDLINKIFWRVIRLFEIHPFNLGNLRLTIMFTLKLIQTIRGKPIHITKANLEGLDFKKILVFASYEDWQNKIERDYELLDNFIRMFL